MTDIKSLASRILLGEDSTLEFKQVFLKGSKVIRPKRNDLADTMAGMANSNGGIVILGIADRYNEVMGIPIEHLNAVEEWVSEICNDSVDPPLDALIRKTQLPNLEGNLVPVIYIKIARSMFVHSSPHGYFRRLGSSNRKMGPELLSRIFQERSQSRMIRFDETIVPRTTPDMLDPMLVGKFLRRNIEVTEEGLSNIRIIAYDESGNTGITVAGVLMCTQTPSDRISHAYIQAVSYAGERSDINYQLDARDIVGPLDTQVLEAHSFVRKNMFTSAIKKRARVERPQYSERAVFEALVNAVAHRDYSIAGARIRLHMFKDRIELYVPGSLTNTLTTEGMQYRQHSRNELIVSLLARCPVDNERLNRTYMMERRGDGVPIILDESRALSGRRPEYTVIDDSELRLIIWAADAEASEERTEGEERR